MSEEPDFSAMQFEGFEWILEQQASFNGVKVPIRVEPEDADSREISPIQREAVRQAYALSSDVLASAAPAVVQNYEVYREMLGDEELPPLEAPVDVWQMVTPSYIAVPPHGTVTTPTFLVMAECEWDPEHGLVVRFRNGHADASSQQGELWIDD